MATNKDSVKWLDNIQLYPILLPDTKAHIPNHGTITRRELYERFTKDNERCKFTNTVHDDANPGTSITVGTKLANPSACKNNI